MKIGAYTPCPQCGQCPTTELDAAYSLAFTDHYLSAEQLSRVSARIRSGRPRPSLPKEQEEMVLEMVRPYFRKSEGSLDKESD
jgi:hypothetical protein